MGRALPRQSSLAAAIFECVMAIPAGFEPATLCLEGRCSSPAELRDRRCYAKAAIGRRLAGRADGSQFLMGLAPDGKRPAKLEAPQFHHKRPPCCEFLDGPVD